MMVIPELPPSRPLTPTEQLHIMDLIEQEECMVQGEPTERDMQVRRPGPRLNIKTVFPRYADSHVKDKMVVRPSYL